MPAAQLASIVHAALNIFASCTAPAPYITSLAPLSYVGRSSHCERHCCCIVRRLLLLLVVCVCMGVYVCR
ncbi:hypothetical protein IWX46DRAFT_600180 [Phyllosticta citricarpa]|uniref:Secreted protein n=1 Tax=Phyllosticta citricarpa TaxID=55181 RepID=A0ABR1MDC2_9PEZI